MWALRHAASSRDGGVVNPAQTPRLTLGLPELLGSQPVPTDPPGPIPLVSSASSAERETQGPLCPLLDPGLAPSRVSRPEWRGPELS